MSGSAFEEEPLTPIVVYSCKKCKKTFSCKRDQLLHKKEVHFQAKPSAYQCKLCSKFFCNNANLERHLRVHQDVRPHVCDLCQKAFTQAVNLHRHYSVHSGDRPFKCEFCEKAFTQLGNLQRHRLTHTGEKPFRCKRCGRYFSQRANLKKHIMGHMDIKPFSCKICQKSFVQLANLRRHLQQSHAKDDSGIDIESVLKMAAEEGKESMEMAMGTNPVAYECAICRCVFDDFNKFEMHESNCNGDNSVSVPSAVNPTLSIPPPHHLLQPFKFNIAELDTHEIIVETSR